MLGGYLLRPYYGISKNFATPSWVFYCAGICVTVFIFLYWLIDVKKIKKIFSFIKPAGSNPLLAYMLPSIIYAIIGLTNFSIYGTMFGDGWVGIIRSLVFSFFILGLTALLTKMKIRLHL
jgi:predicted acyltransferase